MVALAASLFVAPTMALAQDRPALVEVDPVRAEPLTQTMPVLGRIVTQQQGPVAARIAGLVEQVDVEAGDPLVSLDAETLGYERDLAAAEYRTAEAEQVTAREQLELLEGELQRITQLQNSAAFSQAQQTDKQNEIEVARSRIVTASARLGQYRAKLSMRERDLEDAVIRAPYSGVVGWRHVSAGAFVGAGDAVVTLIDDSQLEVEAEIPSDRIVGLAPGTHVQLVLDDGTRHRAEVRAVVPEEDPLTRTRPVRFTPEFGPTSKPLAVAQSVTIELPTGEARQVVTVDKDGVIQRPDGAVVYLVEDDAAALRPVQLGEAVGGRFEVLGGLKAGDLVVIRGNERLRPGQSVTHAGAPAPSKPGNGRES
jgi:RND family efflux transporter MFP subunit